jgi:hypothetical protein
MQVAVLVESVVTDDEQRKPSFAAHPIHESPSFDRLAFAVFSAV